MPKPGCGRTTSKPGTNTSRQPSLAEALGNRGEAAIFPDLKTPANFKRIADEVRESQGAIPIGGKLSANHIENYIDFEPETPAYFIILDGRARKTG